MAVTSSGTMPGAWAPSTSVSMPRSSSSVTSSAIGKMSAGRAGDVADQRELRPRGDAAEDRLRHLPASRIGNGISATTTRAPARSAANDCRIACGVVLVVVDEDLVARARSRSDRRTVLMPTVAFGTNARSSGSAPTNAATSDRAASRCPSSCRPRKSTGSASSRSCHARWAARTGAGHAPNEPWFRNVTAGRGSRRARRRRRYPVSLAVAPCRPAPGNSPAATSSARWQATRSSGPRPSSGIAREERLLGPAALDGDRAAGIEPTAGRRVDRTRDLALERDPPAVSLDRRVRDRRRREQGAGVRVKRGPVERRRARPSRRSGRGTSRRPAGTCCR